MKKVYVIIVILFFPLSLFATPQIGDILIWKGDTLELHSNPLRLLKNYDSLSMRISNELYRQAKAIYKEEADKINATSTDCWRGYRAEWIVQNDSIFLNNIYHCYNDKVKANLNYIFPNIVKEQKVFASWINGELYMPQGKCIEYVHMGYESIFEQEIVLSVEKGLLKNYETYHNQAIRFAELYEKTHSVDIYEFQYININWENLPDLTNKHIQVFIGVQPNGQGQIESIDEEYTYAHFAEFTINNDSSRNVVNNIFITDENNIFIREGIRIAKLIPAWDVFYQRGKIRGLSLSIVFSEDNKKRFVR